jgi:hypothetical protein
MPDKDDKIEIQSITSPHRTERVNRVKYLAMREAMLAALPTGLPGYTVPETEAALLPLLPSDLFPGTTAGWWLKAVQLDLEAKRIIARAPTRPVRLFKC